MLLYRYKDEKTPLYVLVLTGVGWFFAFSVILFIPIDVFLVSMQQQKNKFEIFRDVTGFNITCFLLTNLFSVFIDIN